MSDRTIKVMMYETLSVLKGFKQFTTALYIIDLSKSVSSILLNMHNLLHVHIRCIHSLINIYIKL